MQFLEGDKMSVSVMGDKRPDGQGFLEIPVAFQRVYNQYWEPAIEELGIRCFIAPTCFGKDKLKQAVASLAPAIRIILNVYHITTPICCFL